MGQKPQHPLERLIVEIQRLREAVETQNQRLDEQGKQLSGLAQENQQLRAQLPAPQSNTEPEKPRRGFRVWLREKIAEL